MYLGGNNMIKLGVNIDHVATLRQARLAEEPNLVRAAVLCEMAGADGITIHLREDRRHIQDADVRLIKQVVSTRLNLEMAVDEEIVQIALEVEPDMVTLVPEKREELTTEGGLNILDEEIAKRVKDVTTRLNEKGIVVSLFVDPKPGIMKVSKQIGATYIEIHTGAYSEAKGPKEVKEELAKIKEAVQSARVLGLKVNAGHGLDYKNVAEVAKIAEIEELNIGHSIISKSIFDGIENAVILMKDLMVEARRHAKHKA